MATTATARDYKYRYKYRGNRCCSNYQYHYGGHIGITHGAELRAPLTDLTEPGVTWQFPNYRWVLPDWERAPTRSGESKIIINGITDE